MGVITLQQLLEAGVQFGHYTNRWDPRMKPYIYTARNGIYIIDLQKTLDKVEEAYAAILEIAKNGGQVLFVGTKKQAQEAVKETAIKTKQYYVDARWLGGILTNFRTIRKRIKYLEDLEKLVKTGEINKYPKKEINDLLRQKKKLELNLTGIKKMEKLPQAIFVIDPRKEENAVKEAKKLGIPVFGIVDTNCSPEGVDYVIPANDDAIKSVKLIVSTIGNAIIEANGGVVEKYDDDQVRNIEPRQYSKDESEQLKVQVKNATSNLKKEEVKKDSKVSTSKKVETKEEPKEEKVIKEKDVNVKEVKEKKEKVVAKKNVKVETKEEPKPEKVVLNKKQEPKKKEVKKSPATSFTKEELGEKSITELKALAKSLSLQKYSSLKKDELVDYIFKNLY